MREAIIGICALLDLYIEGFYIDSWSISSTTTTLSLILSLFYSLCVGVITIPVLVHVFYGATSLLASAGIKLCYACIKLSKIVGIVFEIYALFRSS
jgi:hypothetical protein